MSNCFCKCNINFKYFANNICNLINFYYICEQPRVIDYKSLLFRFKMNIYVYENRYLLIIIKIQKNTDMTFQEFLTIAFSPVNTVLSILLILAVIYWLFTIVTGLDIDVGIDADFDADINGPDGHVHVPDDASAWIHFLKFLNLDIVPITYFLTLSLLLTWLGSLYAEVFFSFEFWISALLVIPIFMISILLTKLILKPLNPFFREINHKGEVSYDLLGRQGRMKSTIHGDKIGILEVFIGSDPMTLMVKSKDGEMIEHGTMVYVVDEAVGRKYYYVAKEIKF